MLIIQLSVLNHYIGEPSYYQYKSIALGKFDWGVWYVIIFLYVQF